VTPPPERVELRIAALVVERRPSDGPEAVAAAIDRAVARELYRRSVQLPASLPSRDVAAAIVDAYDERGAR